MKENDNMSYSWWKKKIESDGFYTVFDTADEIVVKSDDACITFEKQTMNYTATGFGGQLAFTTYPIYEQWRSMIKAWINERRRNAWAERKEE